MDDQSNAGPDGQPPQRSGGRHTKGRIRPAAVGDDATQIVTPPTVSVDPNDTTAIVRPAAPESTTILPPLPPPPAIDATAASGTSASSTSASGATGSGASDATKAGLPAPDPEADAAAEARWRAIASAPRSQPPRDPEATAQWEPLEPGRAWWLPIVLAIIGLILLVGMVYLLITTLTPSDTNSPTPGLSTAPPATQTTAPATMPPSAPTSGLPSTLMPSTPAAAGTATVPSTLIGLPLNEAESILDSLGIPYTTAPQPDNSVLPNIVVNTSPGPGQLVPGGGSVTLYYAQPTAPSSPPSPSISPSSASASPSA